MVVLWQAGMLYRKLVRSGQIGFIYISKVVGVSPIQSIWTLQYLHTMEYYDYKYRGQLIHVTAQHHPRPHRNESSDPRSTGERTVPLLLMSVHWTASDPALQITLTNCAGDSTSVRWDPGSVTTVYSVQLKSMLELWQMIHHGILNWIGGCWFQSTVFYYSRMERMTGLVATAESYPSPIYRQQDSEGGSGSINQRIKPNPTFQCDGCDGGPVTYQTRRSVEILDGFLIRTVDIITPCCWTCITWFSASSRIRRIHTESRLWRVFASGMVSAWHGTPWAGMFQDHDDDWE